MANIGKYETFVATRFDDIRQMSELGYTNQDIAENLSISESTLYTYFDEHPELKKLIESARKKPVLEVKSALLKKAVGFEYYESEITKKGDKKVEIVKKKYSPPDTTACLILLKHWARDEGWTSDPQMLKLKKEELELKKEKLAEENW